MKVAAYCRVSTDYEDQTNSFENQKRFFKEYIERQSDWELYEIYADEGITGTSTRDRISFNRMIADARGNLTPEGVNKKIDKLMRNLKSVTEKSKVRTPMRSPPCLITASIV